MYKIKVFNFSALITDSTVELMVNKWLNDHPHLEYANISVSGEVNEQIKYVLIYKLKNITE